MAAGYAGDIRLPRHVFGALHGLIGAGLLVTCGGSLQLDCAYVDRYVAAGACALTWSTYSVLNRRFGNVPAEAVAGFCAVGAAFFFWDHGTKHGNISLLGVLAYFAPLLSTLLLIAFGLAPLTPAVAIACGLIVGGGLVASGVTTRRQWSPRRCP